MNRDMQAHVLQLLKSSRTRTQKIRLLRYELLHHAYVSADKTLLDVVFDQESDKPCTSEHLQSETLYIALNCRELASRINTESAKEAAAELAELENTQSRLCYYVSLLDSREATVIRRVYFDGCSWDQTAKELGVVRRTAHKIKERALTDLAWMYEYMDGIRGNGAPTAL